MKHAPNWLIDKSTVKHQTKTLKIPQQTNKTTIHDNPTSYLTKQKHGFYSSRSKLPNKNKPPKNHPKPSFPKKTLPLKNIYSGEKNIATKKTFSGKKIPPPKKKKKIKQKRHLEKKTPSPQSFISPAGASEVKSSASPRVVCRSAFSLGCSVVVWRPLKSFFFFGGGIASHSVFFFLGGYSKPFCFFFF